MVRRLLLVAILALGVGFVAPGTAAADREPASIPLPTDFEPEGISSGPGATVFVGSTRSGDIFRGSMRTGHGKIFIDAPPGRAALGVRYDRRHHLLFVAGGATGAAYVYDSRSGKPVAAYQFAPAGTALLNDVDVTRHAAYFTDSFSANLYEIPIRHHGRLGAGVTVKLSGPAATVVPGAFNLNGIQATPDGRTLIVNNSQLGALFTINPRTGASASIAVDGLIPGAPDGLLLTSRHTLWVVENSANTLVRVRLSADLSRGTIRATVTSPRFEFPTTVAKHGDDLGVVNAKFDLGLPPPFGPGAPPGTPFEVVVVEAR
jgi:sugar lactone lactonase YvrE